RHGAVAERVGRMTAAAATREPGLKALVGRITGLSNPAIGQKLRHADGRTRLRNVFADAWPDFSSPPGAPPPAKQLDLIPEARGRRREPKVGIIVRERWRLTKMLARGGYGVAYEADDLVHSERSPVVLKFSLGEDTGTLQKEATLAQRLRH